LHILTLQVISITEEDLIRGARIRKLLGITNGQSIESAIRFRDKVVMVNFTASTYKKKNVLKKHNIRVPEFKDIESGCDILDFVKNHGYPCVIKPSKGYGSIGICYKLSLIFRNMYFTE
jgi:hypothetical protein